MPIKVNVAQQRVSPGGFRTAGAVHASPDAFGAQAAKGQMALGDAVQRFGAQIADTGTKIVNALDVRELRRQSTQALENQSVLEDDVRQFDSEYRSKNYGKNAENAIEDYEIGIGQLIVKHRQGISDPRALNDYDANARKIRAWALNGAASWKLQQDEVWRKDTLNARGVGVFAMSEDPKVSDKEAGAAFEAYRREVTALWPGPREAKLAADQEKFKDNRRQAESGRLLSMPPDQALKIARGDGQASAGPADPFPGLKHGTLRQKAALVHKLEQLREKDIVDSAVSKYQALFDAQGATVAMRAALEDKELAGHPKALHAALNHLQWLSQKNDAVQKMQELQEYQPAYDAIAKAAELPPEKRWEAVNNAIQQAPAQHRPKLRKYAAEALGGMGDEGGGKVQIDDPGALAEALDRAENGDLFSIEEDYGDRLTLPTINKLKDKNFRTWMQREKAMFNEMANEWLDTEAGKKAKGKYKLTVNELYQRFLNMIPEGGFKDPAQRKKVLEGAFKEMLLEKPRSFIWNQTESVPGILSGYYTKEGYFPKSGPQYQALKAELERQGLEVSDENMSKLAAQVGLNWGDSSR